MALVRRQQHYGLVRFISSREYFMKLISHYAVVWRVIEEGQDEEELSSDEEDW